MFAGAVPAFMPLPSAKQDAALYWNAHRALLELTRPALVLTTAAHIGAMADAGLRDFCDRLLAIDELEPRGELSEREARPGQTAFLQHSSGTTALKKGVMLSHRAVARQVEVYAASLKASHEDVIVSWLPLYHDMGLIACTIMPLMLGLTIVLLDPFDWALRPGILFDAITEHRGTLCWLPNFAFAHLTRAVRIEGSSYDLSSMRAFVNCSEPCKASTFDRFLERFAPIGVQREMLQVSYAMAETVFAVTQTPLARPVTSITVDAERLKSSPAELVLDPQGTALLSCGPALEGCSITIRDKERILPEGNVGEICIEGEYLFEGYYRRSEITQLKLQDGVYRSGDLGFFHDGQLYVLGRIDDLIIVHGRNYFAHEVEAIASTMPGLKPGRNVAIGIFNEQVGSEDIIVIAERQDGLTSDEIKAARRNLKLQLTQEMGLEVRDVVVVEPGWLVKTTSGKISRSENKRKYIEGQART